MRSGFDYIFFRQDLQNRQDFFSPAPGGPSPEGRSILLILLILLILSNCYFKRSESIPLFCRTSIFDICPSIENSLFIKIRQVKVSFSIRPAAALKPDT